MSKKLHLDMAAEREADEIGQKFRNSSDVVGDMSRAYGADLSSVKIHTDSGAADMVAQRGVDAFSTGTDVFFGRGAFNPGNADSRGLLAHELAHSLQQGVGGGMGAVQQSAPLGAAQGGWFSNWRAKRRAKKEKKRQEAEFGAPIEDLQISEPGNVVLNEDQGTVGQVNENEARKLADIQEHSKVSASQVANRIPQSRPERVDVSLLPQMKKVFEGDPNDPGNPGRIQMSNKAYRSNGIVDEGMVELGIRNASTDAGGLHVKFIKNLMKNASENVAEYMGNLEAGGMSLKHILYGTERGGIESSAGAWTAGGRMDDINSDILSIFGQYASSEEGLEYIREMSGMIGGADVFHGNQDEVLRLLMKSMTNAMTFIPTRVRSAKGGYQNGEGAALAAREALRTLMFLPTLDELDLDSMASIPDSLKSLVAQYRAMIANIKEKLGSNPVA